MNYEPRPDRSVPRRDEDGIDDAGRRLEDTTKLKLLERSGPRLIPTPRGSHR